MNVIDPRDYGDRALFAHLLLGDLPRPGWPGRGRVIARRLLQLAALAVLVAIAAYLIRLAIVVVIVLGQQA